MGKKYDLENAPADLIDRFIEVGNSLELSADDRRYFRPLDWVNRMKKQWVDIGASLEQERCKYLIRGMVTVERELRWLGGSGASVIWVIKGFEERFPDEFLILARWVFDNRGRNNYLPFGFQGPGQGDDDFSAYLAKKINKYT